MSKVNLKCGNCGIDFGYHKPEYNRQIKKGRTTFYCSLKCASKRKPNIEHLRNISKPYFFKGGENKILTEEGFIRASMKEFLRRIKNRAKNKPERFGNYDITLEDLIEIWNAQFGQCVYTKSKLVLPKFPEYSKANSNYKASIDRIDSSKGYIKGNIQFISDMMNQFKSNSSKEEVEEFITIVRSTN